MRSLSSLRCRNLAISLAGIVLASPLLAVDRNPGELVSIDKPADAGFKLADVAGKLKQTYDSFKNFGVLTGFKDVIQGSVTGTVKSMKFKYTSKDSHGHLRTYTGRVFVPPPDPDKNIQKMLPLVVYQHATEVRRLAVPSQNAGEETMLGAIAARSCGFAVAMPDGDGMGEDTDEPHAYCYGDTAASTIVDCIKALLSTSESRNPATEGFLGSQDYAWNGETYIVGYSEGGYIAMAGVRYISKNGLEADTGLKGAACMGGPFSFAKATLDLLQADKAYDRPYIPAYFINSWSQLLRDAQQQPLFKFDDAINPAIKGKAEAWLDGSLANTDTVISGNIQAALGKTVSARKILNESWVENFVEKPSKVLDAIKANDLVDGWFPKVPVLLVHDPYDETVGFASTQAIYNSWLGQIDKNNRRDIFELGAYGVGLGHVGGALVAIPSAFIWISANMTSKLADVDEAQAADAVRKSVSQRPVGNEENWPSFPVSKIERAHNDAYDVSMSKGAVLGAGKVKLYTIEQAPAYVGQGKIPGIKGYTKILKVLRDDHDHVTLPKDKDVYMSVYPGAAAVNFSLVFTLNGKAPYKVGIQQAKSHYLSALNSPVSTTPGPSMKGRVLNDSFENPKADRAFISLP